MVKRKEIKGNEDECLRCGPDPTNNQMKMRVRVAVGRTINEINLKNYCPCQSVLNDLMVIRAYLLENGMCVQVL